MMVKQGMVGGIIQTKLGCKISQGDSTCDPIGTFIRINSAEHSGLPWI
jgi:hypothetical protein